MLLPMAPKGVADGLEAGDAAGRRCAKSSRAGGGTAMGTPHILVVDRYLPFRMALHQYLSARGHAVTEAANVAEALDVLRRENVSLMLIEPGDRAGDVTDLVNRLHEKSSIPVLFVTATAPDRLPPGLRDLATEVFVKSHFTLSELGDAVDRALGKP
jgi:CheY-like chemotaxis protein